MFIKDEVVPGKRMGGLRLGCEEEENWGRVVKC
jgi:hypothetical protein